jgi:hypothetical protein
MLKYKTCQPTAQKSFNQSPTRLKGGNKMNPGTIVAVVILFIGFGSLALSGISFRMRALLNKRAWHGMTLPFLWIGLITAAIGLTILLLTYQQ